MQQILNYINQKNQSFAQNPFFQFLRDEQISPEKKLAFAPCAAPFVMGFGELNKSVFRDEENADPLQKIINHHSYQDACHWLWFLEDLEKLGLNQILTFRDSLTLLWSDELSATRQLIYELYRLTYKQSPLQKLVVIEAIEATGNAFLQVSIPFVEALEAANQEQYLYFGSHHLKVETGRTYCSTNSQEHIDSLQLSHTQRAEMMDIVDQVYAAFLAFNLELLAYATQYSTQASVDEQQLVSVHA